MRRCRCRRWCRRCFRGRSGGGRDRRAVGAGERGGLPGQRRVVVAGRGRPGHRTRGGRGLAADSQRGRGGGRGRGAGGRAPAAAVLRERGSVPDRGRVLRRRGGGPDRIVPLPVAGRGLVPLARRDRVPGHRVLRVPVPLRVGVARDVPAGPAAGGGARTSRGNVGAVPVARGPAVGIAGGAPAVGLLGGTGVLAAAVVAGTVVAGTLWRHSCGWHWPGCGRRVPPRAGPTSPCPGPPSRRCPAPASRPGRAGTGRRAPASPPGGRPQPTCRCPAGPRRGSPGYPRTRAGAGRAGGSPRPRTARCR